MDLPYRVWKTAVVAVSEFSQLWPQAKTKLTPCVVVGYFLRRQGDERAFSLCRTGF
jgi:hypothetical protein